MRKISNSHANRGAGLEKLIDMTNMQYRNKGFADVRKIPTPVQIQSNVNGKVTGYTKKGELVDYFGVKDGRAIVFDAKETNVSTNFPLKNVHEHQYNILKSWHQKGAKAFLLISFTKRQYETYLLPFEMLEEAWKGYIGDGRKSIPYEDFMLNCDLVKSDKGYVLHYLKSV
ncbi:holliday junction resolvase [Psychrobacillus phage PVJ1]|nr:holliday junction resolvase [Psychrobacillus phage PVJ1]